jgi:hypothetical protein
LGGTPHPFAMRPFTDRGPGEGGSGIAETHIGETSHRGNPHLRREMWGTRTWRGRFGVLRKPTSRKPILRKPTSQTRDVGHPARVRVLASGMWSYVERMQDW